MSVDDELSAYNAGARGGAPIGVAPEQMAAYQAGMQARQAGGGGGGGMLLLPFLLALPLVFVVGTCVYPLPGVLTLIGVALLSDLMSGVNALGMLLFLMLPCIAIFAMGVMLEKRLERSALYRQLRHVARIAVVGFVAHTVVFAFRGAGGFGGNTGFLERLSVVHVLLVLAAMAGAHFASRRLDARLGGAGGFFTRFRLRRKSSAT